MLEEIVCNRHYRSWRPRLLSWVLIIDLYTSDQPIVRFAPATLNLTYADMRKADRRVLPGLETLSEAFRDFQTDARLKEYEIFKM